MKALVTGCLLLLAAIPSHVAASGTWINPDNSFWSDATNWLNATVAEGSGNTADFSITGQLTTWTVVLH